MNISLQVFDPHDGDSTFPLSAEARAQSFVWVILHESQLVQHAQKYPLEIFGIPVLIRNEAGNGFERTNVSVIVL